MTTAIAVFVAIALDPATAAPEAEPEPAPSPTPPSPSTDGARAPNETRPPAPARVLAERRKALAALWTIAARVDLVHLRAPEPAWGGRVGAELVRTRSGERLAPALRLSWGWVDFSKVPPRAGEADFRLRTTRAEGCLRVDLAPFVVSGCAGVELGSLRARISEIPSSAPPQATRWVAAVAEIRAGLQVLPWLAIEAETGVLVPFERTSFALISPPRLVYRAPAVLFSGGVGLGVVARFR